MVVCTFCHAGVGDKHPVTEKAVQSIIANSGKNGTPKDLYICGECVTLCVGILASNKVLKKGSGKTEGKK